MGLSATLLPEASKAAAVGGGASERVGPCETLRVGDGWWSNVRLAPSCGLGRSCFGAVVASSSNVMMKPRSASMLSLSCAVRRSDAGAGPLGSADDDDDVDDCPRTSRKLNRKVV